MAEVEGLWRSQWITHITYLLSAQMGALTSWRRPLPSGQKCFLIHNLWDSNHVRQMQRIWGINLKTVGVKVQAWDFLLMCATLALFHLAIILYSLLTNAYGFAPKLSNVNECPTLTLLVTRGGVAPLIGLTLKAPHSPNVGFWWFSRMLKKEIKNLFKFKQRDSNCVDVLVYAYMICSKAILTVLQCHFHRNERSQSHLV